MLSRTEAILRSLAHTCLLLVALGALAYTMCGCLLEDQHETVPAEPSCSPAPEPPIVFTKWRAAWFLGASYCAGHETLEARNACHNDIVNGFCEGGRLGSCAEPVKDRRLLEMCLATVNVNHLREECWELFR